MSSFVFSFENSSSGAVSASKCREAMAGVPAIRTVVAASASASPVGVAIHPEIPEVLEHHFYQTDIETAWLPKYEQKFAQLVKKHALATLLPEEAREFNRLQVLRRSYHHPRTVEEIEREYQRRVATSELVEAFQKYVKFFSMPSRAGTASKEEVKAF